jgi:hypothetical protein
MAVARRPRALTHPGMNSYCQLYCNDVLRARGNPKNSDSASDYGLSLRQTQRDALRLS